MSDIKVNPPYKGTFNTKKYSDTYYPDGKKTKDNSSENPLEVPEDSVILSEDAKAYLEALKDQNSGEEKGRAR